MDPKKTHPLAWFCGIALAGIAGSILAAAPVASQAQAGAQKPSPSPSYSIPVNVNRVLIPVVVRDKHGHLVDGLERQDFTVLDNGKPREITGFLVEQTQAVGKASATPAVPGSAAAPGSPVEAMGPRFIVLLFDDLHLSADNLNAAKEAAANLLAAMPLNTDYVAVASLSGNTNSGLTHDRAVLEKTLDKLQLSNSVRVGNSDCPKMDYYSAYLIDERHDVAALEDAESQIRACTKDPIEIAVDSQAKALAHTVLEHGEMDVYNTFARIERFAKAMAALPGQRLLILASPGFFAGMPQDLSREGQAVETAVRSGVIISTLNASGLQTMNPDAGEDNRGRAPQEMIYSKTASNFQAEGVMMDLANGTGGAFIHDNNGISGGLERLTKAPDFMYMLEISLDGVKRDGSYHKLEVKVDRSGAKVQARLGYPAPQNKASEKKAKK